MLRGVSVEPLTKHELQEAVREFAVTPAIVNALTLQQLEALVDALRGWTTLPETDSQQQAFARALCTTHGLEYVPPDEIGPHLTSCAWTNLRASTPAIAHAWARLLKADGATHVVMSGGLLYPLCRAETGEPEAP